MAIFSIDVRFGEPLDLGRLALLVQRINHKWLAFVSHKHCNDAWLVCFISLQLVSPLPTHVDTSVLIVVLVVVVALLFG